MLLPLPADLPHSPFPLPLISLSTETTSRLTLLAITPNQLTIRHRPTLRLRPVLPSTVTAATLPTNCRPRTRRPSPLPDAPTARRLHLLASVRTSLQRHRIDRQRLPLLLLGPLRSHLITRPPASTTCDPRRRSTSLFGRSEATTIPIPLGRPSRLPAPAKLRRTEAASPPSGEKGF